MVRDFLAEKEGQEPSEEAVGSLTGLLGACFCAAQLLTSYPLGMLSDRIGRRPIMVLGNLSSTLAGVFFGLSSNFLQAVLTRVGGGLLNGIIGAEKAAAGESLNSVEQATAMAYFSLTWGLGALLGPVVGGMLAKPCEGIMQGSSSPLCAPSGLFQRRCGHSR